MHKFFLTAFVASACIAGIGISSSEGIAQKKKSAVPKNTLMLYKGQNYEGESYEVIKTRVTISLDFPVGSFNIAPGDTWEICDQEKFKGNCNTFTESQSGLGSISIRSAKLIKPPKAPKATKAAKPSDAPVDHSKHKM